MSAHNEAALDDGHYASVSTQDKPSVSLVTNDAPASAKLAVAPLQDGGQVDSQQKESASINENPIATAAADRERAIKVWQSLETEDDVKDALGRMIGRVEELASMLRNSLKAQTELENTLTVTRSNLALALSNTEMLEEALKKDAAGRRPDVGWARSSSPMPGTFPSTSSPSSGTAHTPIPKTGFFKFLRGETGGNAATSPVPHHVHNISTSSARLHTPNSSIDSPTAPSPVNTRGPSGLTSPSMPSLHSGNGAGTGSRGSSKREEELAQALQRERASTSKAVQEKQKLEEELESLSQALFEEANRMVATERQQRAQIEEELQNVRQEREALKGALKIVEGENAVLRTGGTLPISTQVHEEAMQKDRPRALTINTVKSIDKEDGNLVIDLSQTPSTSGINAPDTVGHDSIASPVETRNSRKLQSVEDPPKQSTTKPAVREFEYTHTMRGGLSFGI